MPAQISPGDLTKAHAELEGISNCTKCHVLGEKVTESKCLGCHTEINKLIKSGRGYHSSRAVDRKDCWNCHSEHHGRNFRIVNFNKDDFDHSLTGYRLTGKHTELNCAKCHKPEFIKDAGLKKRSSTYLGLETECSSCHEDVHKNSLGDNCSGCHTTDKFIPASKFDHNLTEFKLTGAHINVRCVLCHETEKKQSPKLSVFSPVEHGSCLSCHKDPHNNKFGDNCVSCHNTSSFKRVDNNSFNHDKTGYTLKGMHLAVKCAGCHKEGITVKLEHDRCSSCHSDYHKGEFAGNPKAADCSSCHSENGFKPSLFGIQQHSETKFKLSGSHLAVPCTNCHYKTGEWKFKGLNTECAACHQNVHGNELTARFMPNNECSYCHSVESWNTINFKHESTGFPLLGRHLKTDCGSCHTVKDASGLKRYRFSSLTSACINCHRDVHYGELDNNCENCHSFSNWKPEKFDHNKTRFPLQGAHSRLLCAACHKQTEVNGNVFIKYKMEDFKCAACHS